MGFITCRNSKCKYWFEDSCMENMKGKRVVLDEHGECESFKNWKFDIYELGKGAYNNVLRNKRMDRLN